MTLPRIVAGLVVTCVALSAAGCGGHMVKLSNRRVTASQWKAVLNDWYDGTISERHSCAAVIVASSHLPEDPPTFSTIAADLKRYAEKVCPTRGNLSSLHVGMTNVDVATLAGAPQMPAYSAVGPCWTYWDPKPAMTGLSVCFKQGRVSSLVHIHHL